MSTIERTIELSVGASEAFSYFCEPRALATVFAADRANVEPRQGGPFELFFHTGDSTEGCTITEFDEGRALAAEFSAPTQHGDFQTTGSGTISLRFEDGGDRSTVQVRHEVGGGDDAREYFEQRWEEWSHNLQVLAASDAPKAAPGLTGAGKERFDLSSVELSRVPSLVAAMMPNVADQA